MKKRKLHDPFHNLILDEEEQEIEAAIERGEYLEDPDLEETQKMLKKAAERFLELNRAKPITIRIKQLDLIKVKAKAKQKEIPYQTLLGTLIHQYAEGKRELSL